LTLGIQKTAIRRMTVFCMVRETGLFLPASAAARSGGSEAPQGLHSLPPIQVLISRCLDTKNGHPLDDRLLYGAGNRTFSPGLDGRSVRRL